MQRLGDYTNVLSIFMQQRSFARASIALARAELDPNPSYAMAERYARELFPDDRDAINIVVQKGAVTPTSMSATQFLETNIETLVTILGPASASGSVFARALNLSTEGIGAVKAPSATAAAATIFVSDGGASKVMQNAFSDGPVLVPKKAAFSIVTTRELLQRSKADTAIIDLMSRNGSLSFDSVLFGSGAASASSPAGILNGLSSVGATAGGGDNALVMDLGKLASAVGGLSGGFDDLVFIGGPAAATKIAARLPKFKYPVFASGAVADDSVICLSPSCLAVVGGTDAPKIDVVKDAALHMEDANPAAFSTTGTPNIVAAPLRSLWQTDTVGIRLRASIDWGLRGGGAAFVSSVTW